MNTENNEKKDSLFIRVFEWIAEAMGWIQIVASPFLIGLIIGALIYFKQPTTLRLIFGISVAITGLVIGIIWANKQWSGKGTIHFLSRIMATPELDKAEEETDSRKTSE